MAKDSVRPDEPSTLRITDFSGGQNDAVAPALLNPNEAQKAHFVNFDQKGTIQPQKGRKKRYANTFSSNPVSGLGAFYTKAGTGNLLIASGINVFTDEPHMEKVWNSAADWKASGTTVEGDATADRTNGSLRNSATPPYQNEKQVVTINGAPTGGNFKLNFNGQITADIPYNATVQQVGDALVALSNIDPGDLIVTGNQGGPWTVEFIGQYQYKDVVQMTSTHTLTGGTTPSVTVLTSQTSIDSTLKQTYDDDTSLNMGTKTKTAVSAGKVVLARKGVDFVKTFDTQADWNTGTKTNVDTTSSPGDIKLAVQFGVVNVSKTSQADFEVAGSTRTNVSSTLKPGSIILARLP